MAEHAQASQQYSEPQGAPPSWAAAQLEGDRPVATGSTGQLTSEKTHSEQLSGQPQLAPPALPPRAATPTDERAARAHAAVHDDAAVAPGDLSIEEAYQAMPSENQATIGFIIPFPVYTGTAGEKPEDVEAKQALLPPFLIYTPPAARLTKPAEGEKEDLVHKAQRKWETEEDEARGKTTWKAKGVRLIGKGMSMTKNSGIEFLTRTPNKKKLIEIRLLYPSAYPSDSLKEDFSKLVAQTKKGAQKNSIIATTLMPFALAFDTVTFLPGSLEICCVWAASSWIGTSRATAIANGVTSEKIPLNFAATDRLLPFTYRLHELVAHSAPRNTMQHPKWTGEGSPLRGAELARIILDSLHEQLGDDISKYNTDASRVAEDIEDILQKAAKEWAKSAKDLDNKLEKERKEQAKKGKK